MSQHKKCIHPPLELKGEIPQSTIPPKFSQQIFIHTEEQTDKKTNLQKIMTNNYYNRQFFENSVDVANELLQTLWIEQAILIVNYVRKMLLYLCLLSAIFQLSV